MHRFDWRDAADEPGGIEFNLPLSRWIRLFGDTGFDIVEFIEIQAPEAPTEAATEPNFFVTAAWAHRYPSEQAWVLRKR